MTSARDSEVARSYRDGASLRELGRRYGITRDQVRYILVRHGVPRRPAIKPTRADPAEAWKRLLEGATANVVAKEYGYAGPHTLLKMLREHGYKPRSLHAVQHGSLTRYSYGCRCDDCRGAKSAYAREWSRKARKELTVATRLHEKLSMREHGLPSTYNRGCRCDECRAARSAYDKQRYRKSAKG